MKEKKLITEIQLAASALGVPLWRNNVGVADTGKHKIRYGLGTGSADLIGIIPPYGRFLAVEVKTENTPLAPHQKKWIEAVRAHGGEAIVARHPDEVVRAIKNIDRHRFYTLGQSIQDLEYYGWATVTSLDELDEIRREWERKYQETPKVFEVDAREIDY